MKKGFCILMILCAALMVVSCDKTKSYTEHLKDERKAIDRLIDHEGFKILKHYPSDGVFKENEFVKLDNDVYLNVIDSGNGNRAVLGTTRVLCRFIANNIMDTDTAQMMVDNLSSKYNNIWGFQIGRASCRERVSHQGIAEVMIRIYLSAKGWLQLYIM